MVTWESCGDYRHWCEQRQSPFTSPILIVLFNPGALNRDGERLAADLTLRNIRSAFDGTSYHPFVLNLFDRATKNADELFNRFWPDRDCKELIYPKLKGSCFSGVAYGYGKKSRHPKYGDTIKSRIEYVRNGLSKLEELEFPLEKNGMPMHPYRWGIEGLIAETKSRLVRYKARVKRV